MRVEQDVKLTFEDVLIRPKRSTLISRSDVTLEREFKFRHSDTTWSGVPIVAANMDTTGLFPVAKVLQQHKMITCLQKFYATREYAAAWEDDVDPNFIAATCGSTEESLTLLKRKMATNDNIKCICIDVANGYREVFLEFVKTTRELFPEKIIIAGNVATREMTEALILSGADVVVKYNGKTTWSGSIDFSIDREDGIGEYGLFYLNVVDIYEGNSDDNNQYVVEFSSGDSDLTYTLNPSSLQRTVTDVQGDVIGAIGTGNDCDSGKQSCVVGLAMRSWSGVDSTGNNRPSGILHSNFIK